MHELVSGFVPVRNEEVVDQNVAAMTVVILAGLPKEGRDGRIL